MIKTQDIENTETRYLQELYKISGDLYDSMVRFGLPHESFEYLNSWRTFCKIELQKRRAWGRGR